MSFGSKPTSMIKVIEDIHEINNITTHISVYAPDGYIANFELVQNDAGILLIVNYIPDYNVQLEEIDQRLAQITEGIEKSGVER